MWLVSMFTLTTYRYDIMRICNHTYTYACIFECEYVSMQVGDCVSGLDLSVP